MSRFQVPFGLCFCPIPLARPCLDSWLLLEYWASHCCFMIITCLFNFSLYHNYILVALHVCYCYWLFMSSSEWRFTWDTMQLELPANFHCLLHTAMCSALCNESSIQYNPDKRCYEKIGESTEVALRVLAEKVGCNLICWFWRIYFTTA